jgi:hypothetical protein
MNRVRVQPEIRQLAFSMLVPDDFRQIPIPPETPDFSDGVTMMPVAVFMAGYGAVLASVAARPLAESDQSLMDVAMRLANHQIATAGGKLRQLMPVQKWGTTVIQIEASQPSEVGEMIIRAAFLEDGGTIFNIAMMAPTALWGSVEKTLTEMIDSFSLLAASGPTRGLAPGQSPPARPTFTDLPQASAENQPAASEWPDLRPFALEDPRALDPEETINARFRDAGAGLVPNTLAASEGCIVVGLGALRAALPIPAGWHAVDDGRRALIFDKGNNVQVNLNLLEIAGRSPADIFNEILDDLRTNSPDLQHREFEVEGHNAMQVRNLLIDGESLQQAYLLRRHPTAENLALKVRVTASEENLPRAMDMTGLMLGGMRFKQNP